MPTDPTVVATHDRHSVKPNHRDGSRLATDERTTYEKTTSDARSMLVTDEQNDRRNEIAANRQTITDRAANAAMRR